MSPDFDDSEKRAVKVVVVDSTGRMQDVTFLTNKKWEYFFIFFIFILINLSISLSL